MSNELNVQSDELLVDRGKAARLLGVSVRTIDNLLQSGQLSARRIGKRVLLRRQDLRQFAEDSVAATAESVSRRANG